MRFLKKYWWFIVLLLLALYVFRIRTQQGTIAIKDKNFSVPETENVTTIKLKNSQLSLTLQRNQDTWMVNEKLVAKPEAINAFLLLLNKIQVKSPLPVSVADSLTQVLKEDGIEVKIFENSKQIRHFYVHYTETLNLGGIGILANSQHAFMLEFPNYTDDVVKLFYIQPSAWAENRYSVPATESIKTIETEIPDNPEKSFRIDFLDNEQIRLFDLYNGRAAVLYDTASLQRFVTGLQEMTLNPTSDTLTQPQRAAIVYSQPSSIITLQFEKNEKIIFTFFPIPVEEYLDELGRPVRFDLNRMYVTVSTNPSEMYEAEYLKIHPVLKDISYFNPNF